MRGLDSFFPLGAISDFIARERSVACAAHSQKAHDDDDDAEAQTEIDGKKFSKGQRARTLMQPDVYW